MGIDGLLADSGGNRDCFSGHQDLAARAAADGLLPRFLPDGAEGSFDRLLIAGGEDALARRADKVAVVLVLPGHDDLCRDGRRHPPGNGPQGVGDGGVLRDDAFCAERLGDLAEEEMGGRADAD